MAEQMIQNISGITGGEAQVHVRRVVCLYRVSSVGQVEKDDMKSTRRDVPIAAVGWLAKITLWQLSIQTWPGNGMSQKMVSFLHMM